MEISQEHRKDAIEINIIGKFDLDEAPNFEAEIIKTIKNKEFSALGINLSKTTYIDSSGLGSLIKVLNLMKNEGKLMLLFGASPNVQKVFNLAQLEKFFTFVSLPEFKAKHPSKEEEEIDLLLESI